MKGIVYLWRNENKKASCNVTELEQNFAGIVHSDNIAIGMR